jgi:ATP-dependent RNA helicase DDX23/PRP28
MIPLNPEEEIEARRLQEIADRAEKKSLLKLQSSDENKKVLSCNQKIATFLSKAERERLALDKLEEKRIDQLHRAEEAEEAHHRFITGKALEEKKRQERIDAEKEQREKERRQKDENKESKEMENELKSIREHYLGQTEKKRKIIKPSEKFAKIFQFDWEATDDTGKSDMNPLYNNRMKINSLFGRGYMAGSDQREQRKESNFPDRQVHPDTELLQRPQFHHPLFGLFLRSGLSFS